MTNRISILQGVTERHYHIVSSEIGLIALSPEREAIFNHLAQIHYSRFPEFISDILSLVEKHTDVRITDGPGDETQDILSTTRTGERQLTQCKHTTNFKYHSPAEEMDLLFAACHRKGSARGLLVTNSDVTVQAKRYVTDREFARGANGGMEIDYWNATRIWERIATSNAILAKWFGGMGQTHGLRRFWFNLVIHRMPGGQNEVIKSETVLAALNDSAKPLEGGSHEFTLNPEVTFTAEDWFASDLDLGVNFIGPPTEHRLINIALSGLRIHVTVGSQVGEYQPATYCEAIVKLIGDRVLPNLSENEWWHLIATTPKAFVFLQDIVEPKVIPVSEAQSYVRVGSDPVSTEKDWSFVSGDEFERCTADGNDDLHWTHVSSGTVVRLLLSQRPHPVAAYEHHVRQSRLVDQIADYEFRAVERYSQEEFDRIRRLIVDPRWVIMSANDGHLFWAFPTTTDPKIVERVDAAMIQEGIAVLRVKDEDRAKIVSWIDTTSLNDEWLMNSSEAEMSVPVSLDRRLLWLSRDVDCVAPLKAQTALGLVKFKTEYEAQHGYDFMRGRTSTRISGAEIRPLLFDILTLRGDRMMDIGVSEGKLNVNLRVQEQSLTSTHNIIQRYIMELDQLVPQLVDILGSEIDPIPSVPVDE